MIYLDYNASTPIAPAVQAAMAPFLAGHYGNPSSGHWAAVPAAQAVAAARAQVADLLGCSPAEIVFTSGGTESNNAALLGAFWAACGNGHHIVTTRVEHPAVIEPCRFLERLGVEITYVGVDAHGLVDPGDIAAAIRPDTILVSVMHANNEVGTIQPIAEIARITRKAGLLLHSDAAQSVGKVPTKVDELDVDLLSLAGHKFYGPKGVGALYIREGTRLEPLLHGAGHESGRRAGTENVLLDVGFGAAAELAADLAWTQGVREQRDWLWAELQKAWGDRVVLNGHPTRRLPNTLSVSFVGRRGADILAALPEVAASTGSACHADEVTLSPVLEAMGVPLDVGAGAIRFSLGRMTTHAEVETLVERLTEILPADRRSGWRLHE
ncbi:MAG TPA: cysteine desulfurase family protein [Thermoleophilia bacterium]|nr:cysteine desulfurase family protein [Thermoleophilia bacterium]